jgi:glycine cleavage system H protein
MNTPDNLKYTKEHEWVLTQGNVATIGITDFAQSSLGDIVFVELPDAGTELSTDAAFGVVESIKSVSDLFAPISGKVLEKNNAVEDLPESCNEDPYKNWLIKIEIKDPSEIDGLMTASDYEEYCQKNH